MGALEKAASPSPPQLSTPILEEHDDESEETLEETAKKYESAAAIGAVAGSTTTRAETLGKKFLSFLGNRPISEEAVITWLGIQEEEEKIAPTTMSTRCSLVLRYLRTKRGVVLSKNRITQFLKDKNSRYRPKKSAAVTVDSIVDM